ncbi:GGDEF domain-containing protein [Devosia rhizoryzae]|uniref:diguanylate cyclase n=1 Tax=Devosia rhizoryzae TaxID=2774137 RepID=A0ABX7C6N5_9HYPH|nr:GGDEF domain-containing protein [Devosia rhizoryzae]QQR39918.1 GGDEF domain-containing protein [Devosia rhizoryzae]
MDFSVRSKARVWAGTVLGTLFCVAAATIVDAPNFAGFTPEELTKALTIDILLPTVLAGPLLYFLLNQIRALALARDEMATMATTDSLTGVLNRGAFTMMVEAYLARAMQTQSGPAGSLLVIDADHFKSINDDFGHSAGDDALKQITARIRSALRSTDLVGRIGGEEFGVFLPAANGDQALMLAERIRKAVREIAFPGTGQHQLSVSIGGVTFHNEGNYDRLFKVADQCLYLAKDSGRDRVNMINYIGQLAA